MADKSTSTTVPPHFVALTAAAIVGLPGSIAGGAIGAIVGERNQYVFTDD